MSFFRRLLNRVAGTRAEDVTFTLTLPTRPPLQFVTVDVCQRTTDGKFYVNLSPVVEYTQDTGELVVAVDRVADCDVVSVQVGVLTEGKTYTMDGSSEHATVCDMNDTPMIMAAAPGGVA